MRETTDITGVNAATGLKAAPTLTRQWWVPLAFAVLALLLLLVVPAAVEERIAKVRGRLTVTEHARVLVNDLEASFASGLLVQNSAMSPSDIPAFARRATRDSDQAALAAEVREIGPPAVAYCNDLNDRLGAWDASAHDGTAPTAKEGLELIASAERLDSLLYELTEARRSEVLRLEHFYVITPAILTPIALVAMVIVLWSGRRTLRFARLAAEERTQVVRAAEARAALLRGVTHDIKNPLGAAAGYAQLLEEGVVGPVAAPQLEMVRRIHRLVQTAAQTVADLLELAHTDGGLHIEYATTDLAVIVDEVVGDHQGMAREHGVDVAVAARPTQLVTDPQRVRQILANLVTNAIKYTPSGGHVHVAIIDGKQAPGRRDGVGVEVRDTGPGIPPELHAKVFDEFFRVRDTAASTNGNGLGLAISRRIARLLGGDVTFADGDGGGAVFTLWFTASPTTR